MKRYLLALFFVITAMSSIAAPGADSLVADSPGHSFSDDAAQYSAYAAEDTLGALSSQLQQEHERTNIMREKSAQRYVEYYNWSLDFKEKTFRFQYRTGIAIFIIVSLVVFAGLCFSAWQFYLSMQQLKMQHAIARANPGGPAAPADESMKSNLEISATGVKVNSSVLGVIILVISIAFFYLYLVHVYPISFVSESKKTETSAAAAK